MIWAEVKKDGPKQRHDLLRQAISQDWRPAAENGLKSSPSNMVLLVATAIMAATVLLIAKKKSRVRKMGSVCSLSQAICLDRSSRPFF